MKIINLKTHQPIKTKTWKFPGGELGFKIEDQVIYQEVRIIQRIASSDDLMELILATDALRRFGVKTIKLTLPYVPYARQDRVMTSGESLSIKVIADILNAQKYDVVNILDPHSDITPALIDNCVVETNHELVRWAIEGHYLNHLQDTGICSKYFIVSPDAGALKKIYGAAKYINYQNDVIIGAKHRDVSTGKITHTYIDYTAKFMLRNGQEPACFIVDDICDGGRTFIELAKVLKQAGAGEVYLIVTHGIFSAGFKELEQNLDGIFVTNSFRDVAEDEHSEKFLHQYKIY